MMLIDSHHKMSKCRFGVDEIDYLGHFLSDQGVRTYPSKLEAMSKWPIPTTIKSLRGFLGLTGLHVTLRNIFSPNSAKMETLFAGTIF
jgi:hypothetical protein